ncbi:MAG TPA: isoprenylcysteine carboxylmethyltransferase family protein [Anaerolineales bacterium]|nr:isoprenylcysteine carboxylmethyltransferase family protein [Anaerolineales bacterium]
MSIMKLSLIIRMTGGLIFIPTALGLLLFLPAGRLNWLEAWIYIASYLIFLMIYAVWAITNDPELLKERSQVASNTKGWDKLILSVYTILLLCLFILIGLDAERFHWSSLPVVLKLMGWLGLIFAAWLIFWAIRTNTYASRVARIQDDRGQTIIRSGPYQFVRHPMYAGIIVLFLCTPPALGSFWGLIPAMVIGILFFIRTRLEDQMLRKELSGYEDYTKHVQYRLMPGIW